MATRFKYSLARGGRAPQVTIGAGDTVGTDVVTVNVDATNMTKGDFLKTLGEIQRAVIEGDWFPL